MKYKEIEKLDKREREKRFEELKIELMKAKAGASKSGSSKIKEIKKMIARFHTFNNLNKPKELNKQ